MQTVNLVAPAAELAEVQPDKQEARLLKPLPVSDLQAETLALNLRVQAAAVRVGPETPTVRRLAVREVMAAQQQFEEPQSIFVVVVAGLIELAVRQGQAVLEGAELAAQLQTECLVLRIQAAAAAVRETLEFLATAAAAS
jgi:hypothetical protein